MISNHLFWLVIVLLVWSFINLNVYETFGGANQKMRSAIGIAGFIAGLIRVIMLCIKFNWWWLLGVIMVSLIIVGIIASFFGHYAKTIVGILGILGIPVVWWFGGMF